MNQAIADIIKSHIEGLDFVDKIAGLTRVLTFDIKGPDNTPVRKSFPVACCVTADDCKEGAYNDLMPNSQYKTVIYFEDMGVTADRIEGRYSYFISNVRLVCWINAAKILGDTCKTGTACTLSAHLITEIIRALPEFKQHHNPFNMVLSKVTSQEVSSPSIFSQYTYDEKHTQYLMYPYDYFALDIQTEFAICMKGTSVYDSDCGHRIDTLDAPVATAGTGATDSSFIAHCNAVTGALGYAIDVATDSGFTDFVLQDERIGNIRDVTISGLDDNTTYYYRFRAYNDFTESGDSNTIAVATLSSTIIDKDGNEYSIITIGTQQWIAENLKTTKYADNSAIPNLTLNADWGTEDGTPGHDGAYCWLNNNIANKDSYGAFYNWHAVVNAKKLIDGQFTENGNPSTGWRAPLEADFDTLEAFLGGLAIAGAKLKEIGTTYWNNPNVGATNDYGFNGRGSGFRMAGGSFQLNKVTTYFISSELAGNGTVQNREITAASIEMFHDLIINKAYGCSVRCVRDI